MTYTYKLGNNGPLLPEVPSDVKIKKEEYKEGGTFSKEEWWLHCSKPGSSTVVVLAKGKWSDSMVGKIEW